MDNNVVDNNVVDNNVVDNNVANALADSRAQRPAEPRRPIRLSDAVCRRLRCPVCHAPLRTVGDELHCVASDCATRYPMVGGAPVLINESRSLFTIESFVHQETHFRFQPTSRARRWVSWCLPTLSLNVAARRMYGRLRSLLLDEIDRSPATNEKPRVLFVGSGEAGDGMDVLLGEPSLDIVRSDVSSGETVDCICDGHDLPFDDGVFDGVVVQAVLEHVLDPTRCVEEIHRVLKPDGLVYAETPFIAQVHGRQFDFTRFTRLGHRRLFRRFAEIESGVCCGPGMALSWTLRYFMLSFVSDARGRAVVSGLARLLFFWLKYFDYFLADKPSALDTASGLYFLGRKTDAPLADADLVASYRGGM